MVRVSMLVLLLWAALPNAAGAQVPEEADVAFTRPALGASSGLLVRAVSRPDAVAALSRLTVLLPKGTLLDPRASPACKATSQQLALDGRAACRRSLIGTGRATASASPIATVVELTIRVYTTRRGAWLVFSRADGAGNPSVVRASIDRRRIDLRLQALELFPGVRTSLQRLFLELPARRFRTRVLLRTPNECRREWTSTVVSSYADDGAGMASASQPCPT